MVHASALYRISARLLLRPTSPVFAGYRIDQKRTIVEKSFLKLDPETYPDPWPYKTKGYQWYHAVYDRTQKRFHENSKLIVVEGNIGSKKTDVARNLADRLGFHFIPEFQMEDIIIDRFGNDYREYYHLFPEKFRYPDMDMFYKDPYSDMTALMREKIFRCRFDQYLNALAHILNTGQGVVLERSPHTDFIFTNAQRAKNYIGPEYFTFYYFERKGVIPLLHFWPHLVLYLDVPVDKCLENIKAEGNENKIAVVDRTYLQTIEDSYKDAMKEFKKHSEILVYDWTDPGKVENIVEDIEDLDLDFFEHHRNDLFSEWLGATNEYWFTKWRRMVTDKRELHTAFIGLPTHECGELWQSPRDLGLYVQCIHNEILKSQYTYSTIRYCGDKIGNLRRIMWRFDHEPWFEYYYKDAYFDDIIGLLDVHGDPKHEDYLKYIHHHS